MSIMPAEEQTNQALISVPSTPNKQPHVSVLTVSPAPPSSVDASAGVTGDQPTHSNISNLAQAYHETNVKL